MVRSLALVFIVALAASAVVVDAKKCHALALSGGGAKGSYEAGAIKAFAELYAEEDRNWDVVTGISAGSLNTGAAYLYNRGEEKEMAEFMIEVWGNVTSTADVYKNWPLGFVEGALWKNSVYDNSPLRDLLKKILLHSGRSKSDRRVVFGATSLTTGKLDTWNETETTDNLISGILASSAIPGVFPTESTRGQQYCDGGVKTSVNTLDAVARCLEIVKDPKDVIVDVVLCSGEQYTDLDPTPDHLLNVLLRALEVTRYDKAMDCVNDARQAYPDVTFRHILYPQKTLAGGTLSFTQKEIQEMIQQGYDEAKAAIQKKQAENTPSIRFV